jgi:DegV family protein with EDD domain
MANPPTTATASSGTYQQLYAQLFNQGASHIISIHVAGQLSGILNAASTAAQAFGSSVHVLDGKQISLGLGFQVLAAAESSLKGLSLEAILDYIEDIRRRVRVVAMLDTLEYVRRSGRVSWARAQLGNLLRVKPFLEVRDGEVLRIGEARTRHKGIERLKQLAQGLGALERFAMLHTNAEDEARQILEEINPDLNTSPLVVNVTTVIGTHVGPNGLGFAAVLR